MTNPPSTIESAAAALESAAKSVRILAFSDASSAIRAGLASLSIV